VIKKKFTSSRTRTECSFPAVILVFDLYRTYNTSLRISSLFLNYHFLHRRRTTCLPSSPVILIQASLSHCCNVCISYWMTAISYNSSKTEFPLIRVKQQLVKTHNCSHNTNHHLNGNFGFILAQLDKQSCDCEQPTLLKYAISVFPNYAVCVLP